MPYLAINQLSMQIEIHIYNQNVDCFIYSLFNKAQWLTSHIRLICNIKTTSSTMQLECTGR